jgi:Xaa-Pro aminopeptidase
MVHERRSRLTALLRQHDLHGAALVPGAGLRYLTGLRYHAFERLVLLLLPADDSPPALVLPAMEHDATRALLDAQPAAGPALRLFPWSDGEGPSAALQRAVAQTFVPGARVAVEHLLMRVMELRALEAALPGVQTVDLLPLLASLRMVKDESELAAMTEAVRMIETALHAIIAQIAPGVTERELALRWKNEIMATGAEGESFGCIVASGPNSANPHHHNGERPFQAGDLILLDGGAVHQGYASDITRVVALGEPDPQARRIYDLVLAANAAGRAAVRPGVTGEAIDQAARQVIAEAGYGAYFIHRTGHGLGLDTHEPPDIVAGSSLPLPAGATFTIEPGIYVPGLGGVRIEDDMLVTAEGGRSLTSYTRELLIVPV